MVKTGTDLNAELTQDTLHVGSMDTKLSLAHYFNIRSDPNDQNKLVTLRFLIVCIGLLASCDRGTARSN